MTELHAGGTAQWDISAEVLDFLTTHVKAGDMTLETGAGASSLVFARQGARHTAVTPSADEVRAIKAAGAEEGIDLSEVTFLEGYSQDVLPGLTGELDLVLIDGGHGFPIPAVDWCYTATRLKVGGHMLIDDVDLWTGQMIVQFMDGEEAWSRQAILRGRTAVYQLTQPFSLREWTNQPGVVARSRWPQTWRKLRNGLGLLAKGDFQAIREKAENERRLAEAARKDY